MRHTFLATICTLLLTAALSADVTLTLQPSENDVNTGDTVTLQVIIAGLGDPGPREVGSFDMFIGFNSVLLSPTGIDFTLLLGDPNLGEAITAMAFGGTWAEAVDVSLLSVPELDALQPPSFTLATYNFVAIGSGHVDFSYLGGPVDDGYGNLIAGSKEMIPEPSSLLLMGSGLFGGAWWTSRRLPVGLVRRIRSYAGGAALKLLVLLLCCSLAAERSFAEITVTGDTAAFKDTVNKLLKDPNKVDIDKDGKLTMTGDPTNEFGKRLKACIDMAGKVKLDIKNGGDNGITGGAWEGGGTQTIDIAQINNLSDPGSGLPTKAAGLAHEIGEVCDSVKDGKTDKAKDFEANHKGSATTDENAVSTEESGITRTDEGTATMTGDHKTIKVKRKYQDKDKNDLYIDWILELSGKTWKLTKCEKEPAKPKGGMFYITEPEPGIRTYNGFSYVPTGFFPLDQPGYIAVDVLGNIYVSEQRLNQVLVFDPLLKLQFTISDSHLSNPQGIAASLTNIFVGSGNNIVVFNTDGTFVTTISHPSMKTVKGLALTPDNFLLAASFDNNLILKFDAGTFAFKTAFLSASLSGPEGIAVDQQGHFYVASFSNDKILHFLPNGTLFEQFASGGALKGPKGVALSPQSFVLPDVKVGEVGCFGDLHQNLAVASSANNSVQVYDLNSASLVAQMKAKTPIGVIEYQIVRPICDVDQNGSIDIFDITAIINARNTLAGLQDVRDADEDGRITANDARICVTYCTKPHCAP
jgi:DNA-binding beta-propeller fold protein YncE